MELERFIKSALPPSFAVDYFKIASPEPLKATKVPSVERPDYRRSVFMRDPRVEAILHNSKGTSSFQSVTARRPQRKRVEVLSHDLLCANKRNRKELPNRNSAEEYLVFHPRVFSASRDG